MAFVHQDLSILHLQILWKGFNMTILLIDSGLLKKKYMLFEKASSAFNFVIDNVIEHYLIITNTAEELDMFIKHFVITAGYKNAHLGE